MAYKIDFYPGDVLCDFVPCDFGLSLPSSPPVDPPPDGGGDTGGSVALPGTGESGIYSNSYSIHHTFYFDGQNEINGELWRWCETDMSQLSGFSVYLHNSRLAGILDVTLKINGVTQSTGRIDNGTPQNLKITGIDYDLIPNDVVSIDIAMTSFQPLVNQMDLNLIFN